MSFVEDNIDIEEWKPDLLNLCVKSEPVDLENKNISLKQEIPDIIVPNLSIKHENTESNGLENDPLSIAIKIDAYHKCNYCCENHFSSKDSLKRHDKGICGGKKEN